MNDLSIQPDSMSPRQMLRDRCRQLGLVLWRFGADGSAEEAPGEPGILGQWLRSRIIERMVATTVGSWLKDESPSIVELFDGCWLVPVIEIQRRRRRAIVAAMALGPGALDSEQFMAACQSASLDARATRTALGPIAVFTAQTVQRLAPVVSWLNDDLVRLDQTQGAVEVFSRQLAESYEEINLLYKLGQSMNELTHPQRFVRLACEELRAVIPFSWIAVRFVGDAARMPSMTGLTFISGELGSSREEFDRAADALLETPSIDSSIVPSQTPQGRLSSRPCQVLVHPVVRDGVKVGVLLAGDKQGDDPEVTTIDMKMLDATVGYLAVLLQNTRLYEDQQAMFLGTLEALTASIDAKDPYTCGHSERVAHLASRLALSVGLSDDEAERIHIAGLVHDIGKIGVPESVLCKPGKLTDDEFRQIKKHPEIGYHILRDIPKLSDVLPGVLHHHERFGGGGYPHGIKGTQIPMIARIIGLVDAFDAMSSNRTYRPAMSRDQVMAEIARGSGTQFDPDLARAFSTLDLSVYDQMVARHQAQGSDASSRFGPREAAA